MIAPLLIRSFGCCVVSRRRLDCPSMLPCPPSYISFPSLSSRRCCGTPLFAAACRQCVPPATTNKIWEKELEVEGDGVVRREGEEGGSGYPPAPMVGAQIPSPRHHEVSGLVKLCSVHTTCPRRVLKHNFGPEINVWIAGVICVTILGRN